MISWVRDDAHALWPFKEVVPDAESSQQMMIYPTPAKEGQSLGSPYSDLFREFQGRVVREQSVLLVMGYSFSDEHINNIIYQALTIPSFRLIIFADPDSEGDIAKIKALEDPRIWIIGGSNKEHFFNNQEVTLFGLKLHGSSLPLGQRLYGNKVRGPCRDWLICC